MEHRRSSNIITFSSKMKWQSINIPFNRIHLYSRYFFHSQICMENPTIAISKEPNSRKDRSISKAINSQSRIAFQSMKFHINWALSASIQRHPLIRKSRHLNPDPIQCDSNLILVHRGYCFIPAKFQSFKFPGNW